MEETSPTASPEAAPTAAPADAGQTPQQDAVQPVSSSDASVPIEKPSAPQAAAAGDDTTATVGADPMTKLADDESAFLLGALPIVFMVVLASAAAIFYFIRRRKNWHEYDEVLKIDGGDSPIGEGDPHFNTRDMQGLDATKPSQRVDDDD